jgi:hypothetical protein
MPGGNIISAIPGERDPEVNGGVGGIWICPGQRVKSRVMKIATSAEKNLRSRE